MMTFSATRTRNRVLFKLSACPLCSICSVLCPELDATFWPWFRRSQDTHLLPGHFEDYPITNDTGVPDKLDLSRLIFCVVNLVVVIGNRTLCLTWVGQVLIRCRKQNQQCSDSASIEAYRCNIVENLHSDTWWKAKVKSD